jgi:hypothetical protein
MCCFSGPVKLVTGTNIFARATGHGSQRLVYAMTVAADQDLAMVLPLPVPPSPGEDAVRFINLERYPTFFEDLRSGFPAPMAGARLLTRSRVVSAPLLAVHDVGAFEASFVPALADFDRLDPRFALPATVWDRLTSYRDWGFAVFKLRGLAQRPKSIHPMAFEFAARHADRLFFPMVHVHDGKVHRSATYSHALYCQVTQAAGARLLAEPRPFELPGFPDLPNPFQPWGVSIAPAGAFVDASRAAGLVEASAVVYRQDAIGPGPNVDQWLRID